MRSRTATLVVPANLNQSTQHPPLFNITDSAPASPPRRRRNMAGFKGTISSRHTDFILVLLFFISGLIDYTSVALFGTFSMMQTGNAYWLILRAFHSSNGPHYAWVKNAVAMAAFIVGSAIFAVWYDYAGRVVNRVRRNRAGTVLSQNFKIPKATGEKLYHRPILMVAFFVQAACIICVAVLVHLGYCQQHEQYPSQGPTYKEADLLAIGLLSFQGAGQVGSSRLFHAAYLPTTMITGGIYDTMSDLVMFKINTRQAWMRLASAFALIGGAATAGAIGLIKKDLGGGPALFVAAGLKLFVTIALMFWRREDTPATTEKSVDTVEAG